MKKNIKKTIKFITGSALNVLLALLMVFAAGVFLLRLAGIRPYIVMSGSMEPAILTGSLCFVNTNAEFADVREGDVIAFRSAMGTLVTHRAVAVTEDGVETCGDNNRVTDGITTTEKNYVGETVASLPYAGYAFWLISTKAGKSVTALGALGIFVAVVLNRRS